jgi:hypothetical protein
VVGLGRLELPTSRLSSARSNQLSYKPLGGVSHQQSAASDAKIVDAKIVKSDDGALTSDSLIGARPRRKRNVDGGVPPKGSFILKRTAPMFPRDPIEDA